MSKVPQESSITAPFTAVFTALLIETGFRNQVSISAGLSYVAALNYHRLYKKELDKPSVTSSIDFLKESV